MSWIKHFIQFSKSISSKSDSVKHDVIVMKALGLIFHFENVHVFE